MQSSQKLILHQILDNHQHTIFINEGMSIVQNIILFVINSSGNIVYIDDNIIILSKPRFYGMLCLT